MASSDAGNRGNKKTSSKPSTAKKTRSKNSARSDNTRKNRDTALRDEIFLLVVLAFAIILMLSSFNLAGSFGNIINGFMFGLFGVVEYVLPVFMAAAVFLIVANKRLAAVRIKSLAAFVLLMLVSAFSQKISGNPALTEPVSEFYRHSAGYKTGGGLIGGLICKLLSPLGTGGTYVVLILLIIICIVIITERSFINAVRARGTRVIHAARDDYEYYRESSKDSRQRQEEELERGDEEYMERARARRQAGRQRQEARQRAEEHNSNDGKETLKGKRSDKKVSGVVLNNELTDIAPSVIDSGDLTEVTLDFNEEPSIYNIEDEYSKDIFEPGDDKRKTGRKRKKSSDIDGGITEIKLSESQDAENANEKSNALSEPQEGRTGKYAKADIMPRPGEEAHNAVQERHGADDSANGTYIFPPTALLTENKSGSGMNTMQENKKTALKLQQTLHNFGVQVTVTDISCGPSVTRYELQPEQGTKVAKIVSLSDDIKLNLAAADIRIEAPIPGKAAIGIEVPNKETVGVTLRELLETSEFKNHKSAIVFAVGKDIAGKTIVADIGKMPHLLIAGATGSGKSVCINTIIMSILYKASPDEVKLIMIDPKVVELSVYNGIPHLKIPVVTDPKKASAALNWAVAEMTSRYQKFAEQNVRDLKGYNEKAAMPASDSAPAPEKLPQIVIIIDELADLMMVAPGEVEDAICRLAQLARAAGIHLVIATQRPSVNVITGVIKANIPSRIAFSVSSGVDSRTIIDMNGAEKLLGKGDMLFYPAGYPKPVRVQGAFVSDKEVEAVVAFLKEHSGGADYDEEAEHQIHSGISLTSQPSSNDGRDEYFAEAGRFIIEKDKASIGMLQRYFKIGFNRAARIMDQLCDAKLVGPEEGTKPRKILMTSEEFEEFLRK